MQEEAGEGCLGEEAEKSVVREPMSTVGSSLVLYKKAGAEKEPQAEKEQRQVEKE